MTAGTTGTQVPAFVVISTFLLMFAVLSEIKLCYIVVSRLLYLRITNIIPHAA